MHALTKVLVLAAVGCGHDGLVFTTADGTGASADSNCAADNDTRVLQDAMVASALAAPAEVFDARVPSGDTKEVGQGDSGSHAEGPKKVPRNSRYATDADGYPAPEGASASHCQTGQRQEEWCGNGLDEDCDGIVDEFEGGGLPCAAGCGRGSYVCDPLSNALICQGLHGCASEDALRCGNGVLEQGEQCDFAADGQELGVTCQRNCRRPLLLRCVFGSSALPESCPDLHTCSERVGACMPVISSLRARCPELPREDDPQGVYPMIETEEGQCWITCTEHSQCPLSIPQCYMGYCAVPL